MSTIEHQDIRVRRKAFNEWAHSRTKTPFITSVLRNCRNYDQVKRQMKYLTRKVRA